MSGNQDDLSLPTTCAVMWADRDSFYVRFPGPNGIPCIVRYPKSYSTISQVFGILAENPMENRQIVPRHPSTNAKPLKDPYSPEVRDAAREAMKKLGII